MKHKMKVVPYHLPDWIYFQCQNCEKGAAVARPVWFLVVVKSDRRFTQVLKRSWQNCRNDGSRPPTPYPQELEMP